MKVSQFGPALLSAWEKAAVGTLSVPTGLGEAGRKAAVHLRYRMYSLRSALVKENHPLAELALRAKLSLTIFPDGQHGVIGIEADANLNKFLVDAGVEVPSAPDFNPEENTND